MEPSGCPPGPVAQVLRSGSLLLFLISIDTQFALVAAPALGASAALLPFDLSERGMLGDAGSNLFGFVVGVGLFQGLPTWGLALALAAILAVHWASETVTLSRIIESTPPLEWYDRLGRSDAASPGDRGDGEESGWRG